MRHDDDPHAPSAAPSVGSGYPATQLARSLLHAEANADNPQARERVRRWSEVLMGVLGGTIAHGHRQPVGHLPPWVTLDVMTGGFASGRALSAGPLRPHETQLLGELGLHDAPQPRLALNGYFLSDDGLHRLRNALHSGCYEVEVPEEGALLVVAWLVEQGHAAAARQLVDTLSPHLAELRFYPVLTAEPRHTGAQVCLEDVGATARRLQATRPNPQVLAQREAVQVWAPLYDRLVALWLATVEGEPPRALKDAAGAWQRGPAGQFVIEGGWPCARYPEGWRTEALGLQAELHQARLQHTRCGKATRAEEPLALLIESLDRVLANPAQLTGREVGRIRLALARYVAVRGLPHSARAQQLRNRQWPHATAPTHQEVALQLARRLARLPQHEGVDDLGPLVADIAPGEVSGGSLARGARLSRAMVKKLERCVRDSVEGLMQRGLISSGEVLARVLPQVTSGLRAAGIEDRSLRELYAAIYRAFRRRRSLLLLDLQKQVQIEELPWVGVIDRQRSRSLPAAGLAEQALAEMATLALTAFPQAIVPNKLIQEFVALARTAQLAMPLTEELAADIFMGRFSPKFVEAVHLAAGLLRGSLYARYYQIDYEAVVQRLGPAAPTSGPGNRAGHRPAQLGDDLLAQLCAQRAGMALGTYRPAINGQVIEQQLILTTHNLAALASLPAVKDVLASRGLELAQRCLAWIVAQLQLPAAGHHVALSRIKNAAYAWRQMVFFLSMQEAESERFLGWANERLGKLPDKALAHRFEPALRGLEKAIRAPASDVDGSTEDVVFLGWSSRRHWLMAAQQNAG